MDILRTQHIVVATTPRCLLVALKELEPVDLHFVSQALQNLEHQDLVVAFSLLS
jgi:hypothetical protein